MPESRRALYKAEEDFLCANPQYGRTPLDGCPLIVIEPTCIHSWQACGAAMPPHSVAANGES
jgi:hypothetical protein